MTKRASPENVAGVPPSDDTDEASRIRRLPTEFLRQGGRRIRRVDAEPAVTDNATQTEEIQDTIPCPPPTEATAPGFNAAPGFNLERTLRFAQLVRETLVPNEDMARLLDLAIMRRDAILLQSILRHLHRLQEQSRTASQAFEEPHPAPTRPTILPPPPEVAEPVTKLKQARSRR